MLRRRRNDVAARTVGKVLALPLNLSACPPARWGDARDETGLGEEHRRPSTGGGMATSTRRSPRFPAALSTRRRSRWLNEREVERGGLIYRPVVGRELEPRGPVCRRDSEMLVLVNLAYTARWRSSRVEGHDPVPAGVHAEGVGLRAHGRRTELSGRKGSRDRIDARVGHWTD